KLTRLVCYNQLNIGGRVVPRAERSDSEDEAARDVSRPPGLQKYFCYLLVSVRRKEHERGYSTNEA
ncbi:MAG TPA: hypothetical protein PKK96_17335, partial [Anaerolineales bacterium]|nr:hypothetical protein [Anaerolineales bacterium]